MKNFKVPPKSVPLKVESACMQVFFRIVQAALENLGFMGVFTAPILGPAKSGVLAINGCAVA